MTGTYHNKWSSNRKSEERVRKMFTLMLSNRWYGSREPQLKYWKISVRFFFSFWSLNLAVVFFYYIYSLLILIIHHNSAHQVSKNNKQQSKNRKKKTLLLTIHCTVVDSFTQQCVHKQTRKCWAEAVRRDGVSECANIVQKTKIIIICIIIMSRSHKICNPTTTPLIDNWMSVDVECWVCEVTSWDSAKR